MNLLQFLRTVDESSKTMNKRQLEQFVHEMARKISENERETFLEQMNKTADALIKDSRKQRIDQDKLDRLRDRLEKIDLGQLCLIGKINEEYDDWYNPEADEFLFQDPEGLVGVIEEACRFVHECVKEHHLEEGNEIAENLLCLQIRADGEYSDFSDQPLSVADLSRSQWAQFDDERLYLDACYLAYCTNTLENRSEAIYDLLQHREFNGISLEKMMQWGEEFTDIQLFLPRWIDFLSRQSSSAAERLLTEALDLFNDNESLLKIARTSYAQHPGLYLKYIKANRTAGNAEELSLLVDEALENINPKYLIRSQIALQGAEIELSQNQDVTPIVERYWLEMFRSDTRLVHFARMMIECGDFTRWRKNLKNINHDQLEKSQNFRGYSGFGELSENIPRRSNQYLIALLNGEDQWVKKTAMEVKESLGWSSNFMKVGLAAFLLLLLKSEELDVGTEAMLSLIQTFLPLSTREYNQGLGYPREESDNALLWQCFLRSKALNPMTEEYQRDYLGWLEMLVRKRIEGITESNHTKYYPECAAYAAALGEVLESHGQAGAKQRIMLDYKRSYSRKRSFVQALRNFGMQD